MTEITRLELAQNNADAARAQLGQTMSAIEERLNPRALVREAFDEAKHSTLEIIDDAVIAIRARPLRTVGTVLSLITLFTRNPILRTLASLIISGKETGSIVGWFKHKNEEDRP